MAEHLAPVLGSDGPALWRALKRVPASVREGRLQRRRKTAGWTPPR